jgi:hypothetical protein
MPIHQKLPPCPKKWVLVDQMEATIELNCGKGPNYDRDQILRILVDAGMNRNHFYNAYQLERFDMWYVTLDNAATASSWALVHPEIVDVESGRKIKL